MQNALAFRFGQQIVEQQHIQGTSSKCSRPRSSSKSKEPAAYTAEQQQMQLAANAGEQKRIQQTAEQQQMQLTANAGDQQRMHQTAKQQQMPGTAEQQ
eukprot:gene32178-16716_t